MKITNNIIFKTMLSWIKIRETYNRRRLALYRQAWVIRKKHCDIGVFGTPVVGINATRGDFDDAGSFSEHQKIKTEIAKVYSIMAKISKNRINPYKKKLGVRFYKGTSSHINAILTMDYKVIITRKEWEKD